MSAEDYNKISERLEEIKVIVAKYRDGTLKARIIGHLERVDQDSHSLMAGGFMPPDTSLGRMG